MKYLILFFASIFSFSQSHKLEIEIPNVDKEGIVYIAIYDNAKDFDSGNNSPEIMALNFSDFFSQFSKENCEVTVHLSHVSHSKENCDFFRGEE